MTSVKDGPRLMLARWLLSAPRHGCLVWGLVLAVALTLLAAVQLATGAPVMTQVPWDVPMFLDGAWRILNGQVPHSDFSMLTGAMTWYLVALGMIWRGATAAGIVGGNTALAVAVAFFGYLILRKRTTPFLAFFVAFFWAVLVCAPRPIGDPYRSLTYAMIYNRHGEALVGMLFVLLFIARRDAATRHAEYTDGILAGIISALLLLSKVNFGLLAVAAVVAAGFCGTISRRTAIVGVLSSAAALALIFALTGMDPRDMCADYMARISEQSDGGRIRQFVLGVMNQWWLIPFFLCLAVAAADHGRGSWRTHMVNVFIFLSFWALLATNRQFDESPLLVVLALRLFERVRRSEVVDCATGTTSAKLWLYAASVLFIGCRTLHPDMVSIGYAATKRLTYREIPELRGTALRDFRVDEKTQSPYRQRLSDGVSLLRERLPKDGAVWVWDCTDAYTFALGRSPLIGGSVWVSAKTSGSGESAIPSGARYWLIPRSRDEGGDVRREVSDVKAEVIAENRSYTLFRAPAVKPHGNQEKGARNGMISLLQAETNRVSVPR